MDKLELKHLAPYLPYGLNGHCSGHVIDPYGKNTTIVTLLIGISGEWIDTCDKEIGQCSWLFPDFYPILHPLSDLTKEIEHNGERFVPLIELAKLTEPILQNIISCKTSNWGSGSMTDLETVTYD